MQRTLKGTTVQQSVLRLSTRVLSRVLRLLALRRLRRLERQVLRLGAEVRLRGAVFKKQSE